MRASLGWLCLVALGGASALGAVQLAGCGVDGVTPDCGDAAECGPTGLPDAAAGFDSSDVPGVDGAVPSDAGDAQVTDGALDGG